MKTKINQKWRNGKRRIDRRLDKTKLGNCDRPAFTARNINYEYSDRCRGTQHGGIGAMQLVAHYLGLDKMIDDRLHLLKVHLPYHESDHVLNFAYNAFCGGTCLDDIEERRNDEVFLDALGARRIPDPTTAGDFCRRFQEEHIMTLQEVFDDARRKVWAVQPAEFFTRAYVDMDGSLVETTGSCKQGMDIAYNGTWGYHPLILSLANTREVLRIVNRSGNRPSHEGAAAQVDQVIALCQSAGFAEVLLRGDTDFSQTEHLDRWNALPNVHFIFGYDARDTLTGMAEHLPDRAWQRLERPPHYEVQTEPRDRPENVKAKIVVQREFEKLTLESEEVAEFNYQPTACAERYRMIVVRKTIKVTKGQLRLEDETRYFFYITNDWVSEANEIVFLANDRCHQENLIEQLKNGPRALQAPVDNLLSNWTYMVMTSLAWNLKAWFALLLPEHPRHREKHRQEKELVLGMEFKKFLHAFVAMPAQIVRTGRRWVYRLLSWNPWQAIFFRVVARLRC